MTLRDVLFKDLGKIPSLPQALLGENLAKVVEITVEQKLLEIKDTAVRIKCAAWQNFLIIPFTTNQIGKLSKYARSQIARKSWPTTQPLCYVNVFIQRNYYVIRKVCTYSLLRLYRYYFEFRVGVCVSCRKKERNDEEK